MFDNLKNAYLDFQSRRQTLLIAQRIQEVSRQLTEHIKAKFQQRNNQGHPLFVVMGEHHGQPAHRISNILVVKGLLDQGYKVAVGKEMSHNTADVIAGVKIKYGICSPADILMKRMRQPLIHDDREVLVEHYEFHNPHSLESFRIYDAALYRLNVPISFNDAATTARGFEIDVSDPLTRKIAKADKRKIKEAISANSPEGMHIRNTCMVLRALKHAQDFKPDIYVQECGNVHVTGLRTQTADYPYKESLTSLFKAQRRHVTGIAMQEMGGREETYPADIDKSDVLTVELEGPSFRGLENEKEKPWMAAVMPHIMGANWSRDQALSFDR